MSNENQKSIPSILKDVVLVLKDTNIILKSVYNDVQKSIQLSSENIELLKSLKKELEKKDVSLCDTCLNGDMECEFNINGDRITKCKNYVPE